MSATLDAEKFQRYFGDAPLLSIPGRLFPVEVKINGYLSRIALFPSSSSSL